MSDEENDIAYSADKGKAKGGEGEYGVDGRNDDDIGVSHGNTDRSTLIGCRKCGYPGHMTFECRNGVKTANNRYAMVLDVSSTSSDDEDVRMLRELKASIKAQKKAKKVKRKQKEKRRRSRSASRSSRSRSRSVEEKASKPKKKKEKKPKKSKMQKKLERLAN